jgi:RHS repeat-associated protein
MTDGLGSVTAIFDDACHVQSQNLYAPYGGIRYLSGSSGLTSKGFTGQRADSYSGLDYYNARYYDPTAGQFASADSMQAGLNRFGYVGGNPTTMTDPSGHMPLCDPGENCGGSHGPPPCTGNCGHHCHTRTCDHTPPGCTGCKSTPGSADQCDRSCEISAINNEINHRLAVFQVIMDAASFALSFGLFVWDILALSATPANVLEWMNLIVDGATLLTSAFAVFKDAAIAFHWFDVGWRETFAALSAIFQGLTAVANVVRAVGGVLWFLNPGAILRKAGEFAERELSVAFKAVLGGISLGVFSGAGWNTSELQLLQLQLPSMDDNDLRDTCRRLQAQC